jgi:pimeloyl-ACP methyl ester carboxylesterase
MTDEPTAAQDRDAMPAGLGVLELAIAPEVHCMVEYLNHGTTGDDTGTTAVVLLHGLGRDLDDHRSLAWLLFEAGFDVLNLDLPGHGMSGGEIPNVPAAIMAATAFALADGASGIAYVADGSLGAVLMTLPPNDAAALVMIHPDPGGEPTRPIKDWEGVPSLYVIDPTNARSDEYAKQLAAASRAWNLRCFVHDDEPAETGSSSDGSTWAIQSASLTRSFLLEQSFYWRLQHRPAGDPQ